MQAGLSSRRERSRRAALTLLMAGLLAQTGATLAAAIAHDATSPRTLRPVEVDLRSAPASRLVLLPGIGAVRAQRIVEARAAGLRIRGPGDLLGVPGISRQVVRRIHAVREVRVVPSAHGR